MRMYWKQVAAAASLAFGLSISLIGCGSSEDPLPAACNQTSFSNDEPVRVYFGCGCFWHVQHAFVLSEISHLCRQKENITARTAYAGGTRLGPGGLVCYHNFELTADYGQMGHAEAVEVEVSESSFGLFADQFWQLCPGGRRQDPQDAGGEYRSVIGLPGGMDSHLVSRLEEKMGSVKLVRGQGNEYDTLGTGKVYVYDTAQFPAHTAEKYHQFHDDMIESYGGSYNSLLMYAKSTQCPGDQSILFE